MARQYVDVDGRRLKVTNLDKVVYPETGTTKAEVISYYVQVAPLMVPQAAWRPVTRKRWPDGVGTAEQPGEVFFQKNLESFAPDWVPRMRIEHNHRAAFYPLVNEAAVLAWLGQVAALEIHTPQWRFDRTGARLDPDRFVLDLDPGPGAGLPECAEAARLARALLDDMGLPSFPVTSGSKGIHLYAPLAGDHTSEQVSAFAHELAKALEADHPDLIVSSQKKTLRAGKVLLDWSQNSGSKTTVCPYSLRGRSRPLVAAPRTWEEIDDPGLSQLDLHEVLDRLDLDPMAPLAYRGPDRLTEYRSMRDAAKTPEPVPGGAPEPRSGEPTFVIQEHHARRLHWDFRLEHDGVLVSWAIPKGPPMSGEKNRLAVQTEDHPIEYGSFEGSIPKGEYGAGEVTIWDSGTYTAEKWRDTEVIATLHGRPDGGLGGEPYRFALIRTKGMGGSGAENNWLIHRMRTPDETSGSVSRPASETTPASGSRHHVNTPPRDDSPIELVYVQPMLATPGSLGDLRGEDWCYEMKWDGVRAVVLADPQAGTVTVRGRSGRDVTRTYPEVAEILGLVDEPCVLDGEIVALHDGRPDFGTLQNRIGLTKPRDIDAEAARTPVELFVFDVLQISGESLLRVPYTERRQRLMAAVRSGGRVHVPESLAGGPDEARHALEVSREMRLEGIIAKRANSTYQAGNRSASWIKIKHTWGQAVVVIGYRASNAARAFASLLLAVPDADGVLRYCGRVGSGFGDKQIRRAAEMLRPLVRDTPAADDVPDADRRDATWVRPELVGEVTYAERTHAGTLRHAVWRGWREDIDPADVRWESRT